MGGRVGCLAARHGLAAEGRRRPLGLLLPVLLLLRVCSGVVRQPVSSCPKGVEVNQQTKRIGLVLGCSGARGWAHIAAINAIREMGIDIHRVAGTSMGALVGAALSGLRPQC